MEVIISRETDRGRWPRAEGAGKGTGALALASEVSGTESGCLSSKAQTQGHAHSLGPDMSGAELETGFREGKKLSKNSVACRF